MVMIDSLNNKRKMNRYIYLAFTFFLLACWLPNNAQAQKKKKGKKAEKVTVESRLIDQKGNPIPNATITVGEGLLQTFSDEEGNFSIRTDAKSALLIEAAGYESRWVHLAQGMLEPEFVLNKDLLFASGKDKLHLPLGIEAVQRSMTGAVSNIKGKMLESYPDLSLSNALQGRVLGLTARQTVNGLGNNEAALYIRGLARGGADGIITVVDGIERPIDYLVPEEIASIEVLKDATAKILYGPRAANGVLLVTTKRGRPNTKVLKASVDYGASFSTRMPDYLNSYEYATLYNEARANDGLTPFYSDEDLQGYKNSSGVNDQRYPDVDYYNYFLNNSAQYRKATIEYSGGDETNQYALVLGYNGGDGLEKIGTKPVLDRINLRGNLDIQINKILSASVDAAGMVETRKWGTITNSSAFSTMSSHRPNEYPFVITDPVLQSITAEGDDSGVPPLGGSFHHPANLYGSFMYGGFSEFQAFYGQTNIGLNFDLDDLAEGLSAKAYYTIDNYQFFQNGKTEVPVSYAQRWFKTADGSDTVQYYQLRKRTVEDNQRRQNQNFFNNSGWRATLAYDRTFGKHELSANLTHFYYKKDDDDWIQDLEFTNTTFRVKYGFNNKLYAEATMAYMGSDKMPEKNRYNFFPAVGAAWVISEESFLQDNDFVDFLKIKGSFGILGYDRSTAYYLYENRWNTGGGVQFNERNTTGRSRTNIQQIGNPDLEWEKSREINAGIEGLVLDNHLQFEFNYFNEYRYDIIQSPSAHYSVIAGGLYPRVNQGENLNRGIEGQLSWSNTVGDLQYKFGGNFVYSKNKVIKMNEVLYPEGYTNQTGQPSDAMFGYVAEELFTEQSQLDNHALQTFGSYGLGNIAYQDLNGDNIIDGRDSKVIGNSFPRTSLGIHLDLTYKHFGLFVLGTSELGVDHWLNNSYYWNRREGKYSTLATERWHATNNPDGIFPALTTTSGTNDFRGSTFWLEDASFFRLKNVEISYSLPGSSVVKDYKFYVRGTNLFVLSKNKDLDPEVLNAGVTNYPVFRTIAGGVSVSF
jgi:TonB-linked SusC/RagA family outer membrane protein